MARFNHLAYAIIDLPHNTSASNIRDALVAQGGNPRVTMALSSYGAMLLMFDSNVAWENAIDAALPGPRAHRPPGAP